MICPNFTKVGPRSSRISRSFSGVTPRAARYFLNTSMISRRRSLLPAVLFSGIFLIPGGVFGCRSLLSG
jgi:hypothetical protein